MSSLQHEVLDRPYLYNADACTKRRYQRETHYDPDTRKILLDSRGRVLNSQIQQGLMLYTADLSGSPIRRTARIFMNRVWGVLSIPNIMGSSVGSILYLLVDGVAIPPVQLPTQQMDIYMWNAYILGTIQGVVPGATSVVDPVRRTITINTAPHIWNFSPTAYPPYNAFANFPTVPAPINVISGVQMFRTRYITVQLLLSGSKLLSSSAANSGILGSSSSIVKIQDPSAPAYINEPYLGLPSFDMDFNDVVNTVTVNMYEDNGDPVHCGTTDWIVTELHSEE